MKRPAKPLFSGPLIVITVVLVLIMMLSGCTAKIRAIKLSPPNAYLQLPAVPTVPASPVSNIDLVNYLYELHDDNDTCREQINNIKNWIPLND